MTTTGILTLTGIGMALLALVACSIIWPKVGIPLLLIGLCSLGWVIYKIIEGLQT